MDYSKTNSGKTTDSFFGLEALDEFRALEDDRGEETKAWVKSQKVYTRKIIDAIPYRKWESKDSLI